MIFKFRFKIIFCFTESEIYLHLSPRTLNCSLWQRHVSFPDLRNASGYRQEREPPHQTPGLRATRSMSKTESATIPAFRLPPASNTCSRSASQGREGHHPPSALLSRPSSPSPGHCHGSPGYTAVLDCPPTASSPGRDGHPTSTAGALSQLAVLIMSFLVQPLNGSSPFSGQRAKSTARLLRPCLGPLLPEPISQPHVPTLWIWTLARSPSLLSCPIRPSLAQ